MDTTSSDEKDNTNLDATSSTYSTADISLNNSTNTNPCITMLNSIMENLPSLEEKLEAFHGIRDSTDYRFLEKQLTYKLLALDGIGKSNFQSITLH